MLRHVGGPGRLDSSCRGNGIRGNPGAREQTSVVSRAPSWVSGAHLTAFVQKFSGGCTGPAAETEMAGVSAKRHRAQERVFQVRWGQKRHPAQYSGVATSLSKSLGSLLLSCTSGGPGTVREGCASGCWARRQRGAGMSH